MPDRRSRGYLIKDINDLLNSVVVTGDVGTDKRDNLTVANISKLLVEVEQLDKSERPSSGAVSQILLNWEKIGYAELEHEPKLRFIDFTPEGRDRGLEELQAEYDLIYEKVGVDLKKIEKEIKERRRQEQLRIRAEIMRSHSDVLDALAGEHKAPKRELPF